MGSQLAATRKSPRTATKTQCSKIFFLIREKKKSLLLTFPKRRGHNRQGHVGKHWEELLVGRQKEQEDQTSARDLIAIFAGRTGEARIS